jgi:hypothetical protein
LVAEWSGSGIVVIAVKGKEGAALQLPRLAAIVHASAVMSQILRCSALPCMSLAQQSIIAV